MKLYEILLRKIGLWEEPSKPQVETEETNIYNPIGCKVGGVVKINAIDLREYRFIVKEIQEYSVALGGGHKMVDYVLLARPIGQGDFNARLRVVPDPDSKSTMSHRALLLTQYDSLAYDEGLHNVVRDESKKFVIDDDKNDTDSSNDEHFEFWRVNDVQDSYTSKVKILADKDGDGKVGSNEIATANVEFWDFSRLTDVDGVETEEFVFVEMDKGSGWFTIWRGVEVSPERIDVF